GGRAVETAAYWCAGKDPAQRQIYGRVVDQLDPLRQLVGQDRDEFVTVVDVAVEGQPGPQQARLVHQLGDGLQVLDGGPYLELRQVHRQVRAVEEALDRLQR